MSERTDEQLLPDDGQEASEGRPQRVPVNMYEADQAVVVVAPMPAVMPDDIRVSVEGSRLTLAADLRTQAPKDYLLHEWHYGPYERAVELPDGFRGPAEATFANGQLTVRVKRGDGHGQPSVPIAHKR